MAIKESILPELDHEMAVTRKLLERVPEQDADWKPHPKSMSLGQLSAHIANIPGWGVSTMTSNELDVNPPGGEPLQQPGFESTASLLERFDDNVRRMREAVAAASDADLMEKWALKNGGNVFFDMPRVTVLRTFITNHLIHHRGQLAVFLRLRDVPIPSIYGPSADEPM